MTSPCHIVKNRRWSNYIGLLVRKDFPRCSPIHEHIGKSFRTNEPISVTPSAVLQHIRHTGHSSSADNLIISGRSVPKKSMLLNRDWPFLNNQVSSVLFIFLLLYCCFYKWYKCNKVFGPPCYCVSHCLSHSRNYSSTACTCNVILFM